MKLLTYQILLIITLLLPFEIKAQSKNALSAEVVEAIRTSDSGLLAKSFFVNVEIVMPSKTGVFSKNQAEMVMKDFFKKYPVDKFKIIHKGEKENASFAIGNYDSSTNHFRFTFLTKSQGSKLLIHQLRIEKQDE